MPAVGPWREVGDRVFVRRYRFYDQSIGAVVGRDAVALIDTRTTPGQARELRSDLRSLTTLPPIVVNTHGHYDHVFGNHEFRPAPIWGHVRCATMIERTGERQRSSVIAEVPALADELAAVVLDPPDRTFETSTVIDLGGRTIDLRYLGRGHTDNDIAIVVSDAAVLFAGDLLENGATPYFGDGYPIDWPATGRALAALVDGVVVPGHGEPADRAFAERQAAEFEANADLARRIHGGELDLEAAVEIGPYPRASAREPLERALAQLRGELD
jgi:glyoxylase-like metal-dependent hydrolase (beta-lactamase superfamily II)